ncbi:hypothetical protein [Rubritalea halochordaticola]|uniref:hypothetical protein n=1 Tax=Rubritalea halochordaticola TaxID=714537 RepID=UPI0031FBF3FB
MSSHQVYGVMRLGHLLLVLPQDRDLAFKTLSLYQPQKKLAKLYVQVVLLVLRLGLPCLLKKFKLTIRLSSPLAEYSRNGEFGFLLGNPTRDARRMLCLYETKGQSLVSKLGIGGASRDTVSREIEVLEGIARGLNGAPEVISYYLDEELASFTVLWVEGCSPTAKDEESLIAMLQSWEVDQTPRPVGSLPFWNDLVVAIPEGAYCEFLDSVSNRLIKESIVHGDFAPWNVKCNDSGDVSVLDWEFCRAGGPAGIDAAHYMLQTSMLVRQMSPKQALKYVYEWANSTGKEYLYSAGWKDSLREWMGLYLLYSQYVLGMDREELLTCWKEIG